MFTQSHYIEIAKTLKETKPQPMFNYYKETMWWEIKDALVKLFKEDNDNFNEQKFNKAVKGNNI